jgi:hypothetical protein
MSTTKEFDGLRRKVYLTYHKDGILDLIAGSIMLGFGTFMMTDNIAFLMAGWFAMMLYVVLKNRITVPRFGFVRFESEKQSFRKGLISVSIGVLVVFFLFALNFVTSRQPTSPEVQDWIQRYHMVPLSTALFGLPALIGGMLLGQRRFYLYALLASGLPLLGAWLNIETYIPIQTTGLIILVFGIILLSSFLKRYPINGEDRDANG